MENAPKVSCPKCSSESISANKKSFSAGKAAAGAVLTGGIGLAAGAIGSNKIINTCMNCGHQWAPGEKPKFTPTAKSSKINKIVLITVAAIIALIIIVISLSR